jgi:phenylpyruvate tautomerase PptA (4-oxalocrotonate tautomerase family)
MSNQTLGGSPRKCKFCGGNQWSTDMPNVVVKIPEGVFGSLGLQRLAEGLTAAARQVEQIGDDPQHLFLTWIAIEEVKPGCLFAGGADPLARVIPVIVFFYTPAGLIDQAGRAEAIRQVHEAVAAAKPAGDPRPVMTSVMVTEIADGTWGANGAVWRLPEIAQAAGYKHLQHLVHPAAAR